MSEIDLIRERYSRRSDSGDWRYEPSNLAACLPRQERERALIRLLLRAGLAPFRDRTVLEVGCGTGKNLLDFVRLGFLPENLAGNELLPDRVEVARRLLPAGVRVFDGDARELTLPEASFDIVYQSTVFSSILDRSFQQELAAKMWSFVRPGGGVLWYDFAVNNPRNPDVRGVPFPAVRDLFPGARIERRRITLAPPLARAVVPVASSLYAILNVVPWLRTHQLCWIAKKPQAG